MSCLTYRSLFICSLVSFCGLFTIDSQNASAQIVPDQTTATEVNGNAIAPVGSGTVSGGNLYHSFDQLNVPKSGVTFSTGTSTVDGGKIDNILNRVTGENPSQISGAIESRTAFPNANLYLMNPNGVVFGKDAKLDIGGSFNVNTGTSLGFTGDRQFSVDKAKLDFPSGNPQNIKFGISQPAAIINQGNLSVDAGKNITFTAGSVINSGDLTAPSGNVALTSVAGGSLVDLRSPDLVIGLSVAKNAVPTDWNGEITTLPKLAELLTGKAEQGDRVVVKPDGTLAIVATPAANELPLTNGTTIVSGNINVSSTTSQGGNVGVFGDRVALINSQITSNSGNVLIGGDLQGKGVVPNAKYAYVDNKSIVDVSALQNGTGGKVIIWSDRTTQFFGTILSKGGRLSGNGGFVEVSGKENLLYRGNVDTSASNGNFGTLLLDPNNITIDVPPSLFGNNDGQLAPNVPTAGDPAFAIFFGDGNNGNGGFFDFLISNTALNAATSNIILQARNDINVNAPVTVAAANISFTAQAGNNINVNQNIQTNRGAIALLANIGATATGTGSVQFNNPSGIALSSNGGNITLSGTNVNALSTTVNFRTFSLTGGGSVDLSATDSINMPNSTYVTGVTFGGSGSSGNVNLTANSGNITVGDVISGTAAPNNSGNGGNVNISAGGSVSATLVDSGIGESTAAGNAGTITIRSTAGGAINVGNITSGVMLGSGNGNDTTISTSGAVTLQSIGTGVVGGSGSGGDLSITGNSISATAIGAGSTGGTSGTVELNAVNNITADYILNIGASQGGDVTITSNSGTISLNSAVPPTAGVNLAPCVGSSICTAATNGTAGNITIAGNLTLNNATKFLSTGTPAGGVINLQNANINGTQNLTIDSGTGAINLGNIGATNRLGTLTIDAGSILASQAIAANDITLTATGNITTQLLDTSVFTSANAGNVSVQSANGNVSINAINTTASLGNAGIVTIQANDDIQTTGNFTISGQGFAIAAFTGTGNGGTITLTSTNGSIDTQSGTVSTSSSNGTGSNITFTSNTGAIATGDLVTSGLTQGGDIFINALTQIDVGQVTSSSSFGSGGDVTLDPIGNVTFTSINATGNTTVSGNGGNINIVSTEGNVLGTGVVTFATGDPCAGATICTNGTGTVSIQHGISSVFDLNAFLVNSPDPTNGTAGTIVTGSGSLLSFTGIPNGAGFFTQGNISITPGQGIFIPPVVPPVTPPIVPPVTPPVVPPPTEPSPPLTPPIEPNENQTITPINPIIVASISPIVIGSTDFPFLDISKISNAKAGEYLALGNFEAAFNEIEKGHLSAYENYLGETLTPQVKNIDQLQEELDEVSQLSGSATTVVYPIILDDRLELMIIPPKGMGKPFREFVTQAKESEIVPVILDFANNVRDYSSQDYLEQSQQLYNWLVRPYSARLQTLQDKFQPTNTQANPKQLSETEKQPKEKLPPTLVFVMDGGLRVIPVAALHDGKQFLIEKYALANLPYLRVSRLENRDRNINSILAMGLTEDMQGFTALPSVKIEVSTISSQALKSSSYLDQEFTVSNLQDKRRQGNFAVLHLATHAQFTSNDANGAFIQFWNERLSIDRIPSLRFDSPLVEMLTLSACQTAVGQNLGLGGLAISSGAKSVLASLWEVSDSGTAPLMIQFYNSFPENITKAIALQRAQIDMLSGKVRIEDGNILGIPKLPAIPVSTLNSSEINLKHPFYWSSFILIGNWL